MFIIIAWSIWKKLSLVKVFMSHTILHSVLKTFKILQYKKRVKFLRRDIILYQTIQVNTFKLPLEVKRDQAKRDQPKGTGQKGPAKRDQHPKGTMAKRDHDQKGPWPKGTMY